MVVFQMALTLFCHEKPPNILELKSFWILPVENRNQLSIKTNLNIKDLDPHLALMSSAFEGLSAIQIIHCISA